MTEGIRTARRRRHGVSLLEIMLAMSLMSVVIIAFAAVFPSGYRLNFATHNQAKATGFANSIIEQLANQSPGTLAVVKTKNYTIAQMVSNNIVQLPTGVQETTSTSTNQFWVSGITLTQKLQTVQPFGPSDTQSQALVNQIDTYEVTVTIDWNESRLNPPLKRRSIAVSTLINNVMSR